MFLDTALRAVRKPLFPLGAAGSLVALLGASMIARGQPGRALSLAGDSPAAFVVAGFGLIALACGRKLAAAACGALCALLGTLGFLVQQAHPGSTGPAASICVTLAGAALIAMATNRYGRSPFVPTVFGAILATVPTATLLGGLSTVVSTGRRQAGIETAAAFLVLGAGLLAAAVRLRKISGGGARLAPALAGACVLSATVYFSLGLSALERSNVDWGTELAATRLARDLTAAVDDRTLALVRTARLWQAQGEPAREQWESDSRLQLSHFPDSSAMSWWDASLGPRWTIEAGAADASFGWNSWQRPLGAALARCRGRREATLVDSLKTPGGLGFAVCAPAVRNGVFQGAVVGVFRIAAMLDSVVAAAGLGGYSIELLNEGERVYDRTQPAPRSNEWARTVACRVQGKLWQVRVWPGEPPIARQRSGLPAAVLLLGSVLACLSALAVHLAQTASLRARQAESINRELQREIAERRLAEEELARSITRRASEQRYRELFDNANDLIYVHDLDGKFLAINKAAQRITGYSQDEALALNIAQLVAPEHVELARGMVARQLAGEPASTYEVSAITKSGVRLALELSTHLLFRDGNPIAVQGIARDVTERKRLEDQFRQSQKMEAVGRLAGGLAHDFNNLLTVVGAYSQMISDDVRGNPQIQSYAEEIIAAAARAGALTARLLAFSRRQMLQPQVLNINQLIVSIDNMLRRLIGEDIDLRIVFDSGVGAIKADPGQVEQVIMNLAVNARDAMPRGGRLAIQTANVECSQLVPGGPPPGAYVTLAVSDTGVGMSAEILSHIFEPFFTTKEPGKGTGLGLSTVYGIVKQSGGEIAVDSEPDKGSTFRVYFPRCAEAAPGGVSADFGARPRDRVTILLVEDEAGVRRLVRRMLVERGYRVLEAAGADEALAVYEKQREPIDLVLTDVMMPNMTGNELAERLLARRPSLKVLYMTGYSEEAILQHGQPARPVHILKKPFLAEALDRKVRELLESRAGLTGR